MKYLIDVLPVCVLCPIPTHTIQPATRDISTPDNSECSVYSYWGSVVVPVLRLISLVPLYILWTKRDPKLPQNWPKAPPKQA